MSWAIENPLSWHPDGKIKRGVLGEEGDDKKWSEHERNMLWKLDKKEMLSCRKKGDGEEGGRTARMR